MRGDSFFKGELFGLSFSESWVTPYLYVHFLSGFVLYYFGYHLFKDTGRAVIFASVLHLLYELKDFAAFYEEPWAVKFNDWEYNYFLAISSSHQKKVSSINNVPINSILDQALCMVGIYIAYRLVPPNNHLFYILILLFSVFLTIIFYLEYVYRDDSFENMAIKQLKTKPFLADTVTLDGKFDHDRFNKFVRYASSTNMWTDLYPNTVSTTRIPPEGDVQVGDIVLENYVDSEHYLFKFVVTKVESKPESYSIHWQGKIISPEEPELADITAVIENEITHDEAVDSIVFTRRLSFSDPSSHLIENFLNSKRKTLVDSHNLYLDLVKKQVANII